MEIASQIIFWLGVAFLVAMALAMYFRSDEKKPQSKSAEMVETLMILTIGMSLMAFGTLLERFS